MPSYDTYAELARIRAATNASLAFNQIQTGLLSDLSGTMNAIDGEIAAVRQAQTEALAVQQTLLQQEVIQGQIEEFIFQTEKLVSQCSQVDCQLPPSTRFFLLKGVADYVKQNGISTPVIRGRDNKTAFETVIKSVQKLAKSLQGDPEVREAIAWANEEQKRVQAARKKQQATQQAEREKAQQARQKRIQQLEVRYSTLNARINAPPEFGIDDFKVWYGKTITPFISKFSGPVPDIAVHLFLWIWGSVLFPLFYLKSKIVPNQKEHAPLRAEMRQIEDELNVILADQSVEGPVTGIVLHSEPGGV